MKHEIIDMIAQCKIEGRKPRFNSLMVKFIVKKFTEND